MTRMMVMLCAIFLVLFHLTIAAGRPKCVSGTIEILINIRERFFKTVLSPDIACMLSEEQGPNEDFFLKPKDFIYLPYIIAYIIQRPKVSTENGIMGNGDMPFKNFSRAIEKLLILTAGGFKYHHPASFDAVPHVCKITK